MIKTSGYRVSPTEVEEAAYATGLVATRSRSVWTINARPADRPRRSRGAPLEAEDVMLR